MQESTRNETIQQLLDIRKNLGVIRGDINKQCLFIKDSFAYDRIKNASIFIKHAIEQIVLAIDDVEHSNMYNDEDSDG